jgi:hypothetical protein
MAILFPNLLLKGANGFIKENNKLTIITIETYLRSYLAPKIKLAVKSFSEEMGALKK